MKPKVSAFVLLIVMVVTVGFSWGFTEGVNNFFGSSAGLNTTSSSYNSFFGDQAGWGSTGANNSFFGANAGALNYSGNNNSNFGYNAGHGALVGSGGGNNSCFGNSAGYNITGNYNSFFGDSTGYFNSGNYNSFFGNAAGYLNQTGGNNSFVGHNAGYNNTTGGSNSFVGDYAGFSNTTGISNSFFGDSAGYNNLTGSNNVFIGRNAGFAETGSNKLYIDNGANSSPLIYGDFSAGTLTVTGALTATSFAGNGAGLTNVVAASAATCTQTSEIGSIVSNSIPRWNGIQLIDGSISDTGTAVTIKGMFTLTTQSFISDERYKRNIKPLQLSLDKLSHLTGVSYNWKTDEYSGKGFTEGKQIGLIAQDVEKVFPELVAADDKGYLAIEYNKLVPVLIEAVKEQQVTITEHQASIKQKDSRIEKLEKMLELMEQRLTSLESQSQKIAFK